MKYALVLLCCFAALVVQLGAYTRLTHAGLGCPDWPGCYGQLTVTQAQAHLDAGNTVHPQLAELHPQKAWTEMVHRYVAGALGLMILWLAFACWKQRQRLHPAMLPLSLILLGGVIFQALLGMWTVTLKLHPLVVMAHLLGGFTIFTLLMLLAVFAWQTHRIAHTSTSSRPVLAVSSWTKRLAKIGFILVLLQIMLGGWTSANYAALACVELPLCQGDWVSQWDPNQAFSIPEAENYEMGTHADAARITIHVSHRIGALVVSLALLWLSLLLWQQHQRIAALTTSGLLLVQVGLGIGNIIWFLPVANAVAHNGVAGLLLAWLVVLNALLVSKQQPEISRRKTHVALENA